MFSQPAFWMLLWTDTCPFLSYNEMSIIPLCEAWRRTHSSQRTLTGQSTILGHVSTHALLAAAHQQVAPSQRSLATHDAACGTAGGCLKES